ncbi:MAG: hypothetical protein EAY81_11120 [Bacteroidetes bacterium]|nr:MAG: hypothetical protein EAY81_11120 [Bacteroidota bacterium]
MKLNLLFSALLGLAITANVSAQQIKLSVLVTPENATVLLNGSSIGVTPFNDRVKLDFNEYLKYKLTIKRDGFMDTSFWIDAQNYKEFDANKGYKLEFSLKRKYKKIQEGEQKLPMAFEKMVIDFTNGQKIGEVVRNNNKRPFYWEESGMTNATVEFNTIAERELGNGGYEVVKQGKLFADEEAVSPKLLIGGNMKGLNFVSNYTGGFVATNTADVEIEWQIYNRIKNKVVFTYTTKGTYTKANGDAEFVIKEGFRDALINLINEDTFAAVVLKQEKVKKLDESINPNEILIAKYASTYKTRADMLSNSTKSCVTIKADEGHGSGFVISTDGYIITNHHVIDGSKEISVLFENGFNIPAELVYSNADFDLALIKLKGKGFTPLPLGSSEKTVVGSDVFAIGTPKMEEFGQTVTRGILSAKRTFEGRTFLQTDASVHPGNSGGPLLNEQGAVIGINTYKFRGAEGLNLSIPIEVAIEKLNIKTR